MPILQKGVYNTMSRVLKFRAWDKVAKKYLYPWPHGFHILGETTCFDTIGMELKKRNPEKTVLDMLNDVEIEQFTGLLDKSGKEIYEGDIIETKGRHNCKAVVEYKAPSFRYIWSDGITTIDNVVGWNDFEVIGDIHSNPELLKDRNVIVRGREK